MVREGAEANKYEVDPFPEYVLYLRVRTKKHQEYVLQHLEASEFWIGIRIIQFMLLYTCMSIFKTLIIEIEISEFTCHHALVVNKQFLQINFKSDNHI